MFHYRKVRQDDEISKPWQRSKVNWLRIYQSFDAGSQTRLSLVRFRSMRGIAQKAFCFLLLLSLFFSISHFCGDNIVKKNALNQISLDQSAAAQDLAKTDGTHACHLGCCPVASYNPGVIKFGFDTSLIRVEGMRLFETSSIPPPFKPPIA